MVESEKRPAAGGGGSGCILLVRLLFSNLCVLNLYLIAVLKASDKHISLHIVDFIQTDTFYIKIHV